MWGQHRRRLIQHPADLTDHLGFGVEKRRQGNLDILAEKKTFRCVPSFLQRSCALITRSSDAFREMLESVSANGHTFEECKEVLKKSTFRSSL